MSSVLERIPLAEAEALANEVVELLAPACERWVIGGSIRRKRPTIGDLELIVEPQIVGTFGGLFGDMPERHSRLEERVANLLTDGVFALRLDVNDRPANGSHYKRLSYRGRALDLFIEDRPERWGVALLLRTGSAEFNHRLVTPKGQGGWMPSGLRMHSGAIEKIVGEQWEIVPTYTEEQVFALLRQPWVEPERREVT